VIVAITLAGLAASVRYLRPSEVVAHALAGIAHGTPLHVPSTEEYPPLKPGGYQAGYTTGLTAASAALLGVRERRATGDGQLFDVSMQASLAAFDRINIAHRTYDALDPMNLAGRTRLSPNGKPSTLHGLVPCADGYFAFQASEQYQWDGLMRAMGDPEWAKDPRFQLPLDRATHWDEIEPHFLEWTMQHTKVEIFHAAQAQHVPVFPCYSVAELLEDAQPRARAFFMELPAGERVVRVPGAILKMEETPWQHDPEPPEPGRDNALLAPLPGRVQA
jgi:crotonobetainyl-CoA:carnitine CoA-transferase CaiB-like acyl-CoA transferase